MTHPVRGRRPCLLLPALALLLACQEAPSAGGRSGSNHADAAHSGAAPAGAGPAAARRGDVVQRTQALTEAEVRTINFELLSDWQVWAGSGSIASSSQSIEGASSLAVSGIGYAAVRNVTPLTQDDLQTPEVVGYDLWIPENQVNPAWHGDTQLSIDAPSAGVHQQYLGHRAFNPLPKGQWVRVEFPVPNWIRQALDNSSYTDLRFVIAINAPQGSSTHYLDRFTLGPVPTECTPVDDGNPCTADECDPTTGQTSHVPLAPDALCSDGNACNGIETCDGAGTCVAGEAPAVDDANPCTADACDPETGVSHTPVAAGTSCADEDLCNGDEVCDGAGSCQAGTAPSVDDENPCTEDSCDPALGVQHFPVSAGTSCGDADACNGAEVCDAAGVCQMGSTPAIDDGNPCTVDACDPIEGVTHSPVATGAACGDANLCNGDELCDGAGTCQAGVPPIVDDGNPCTADACDPTGGVSHIPVSAGVSCGDGNACNGGEVCDGAGTCQAGAPPDVDDGNPCTADACDPSGGVSHVPVSAGVSCADADLCNGAEACDGAGSCQPGTPVETDDGNACTIGSCDPATGAVSQDPAPLDSSCSDSDVCNGFELCDGAGTCQAGTAPEVDDGNACTADSCDPTFGVDHSPTPAGSSCADATVCNGAELCDGAGSCQPGTPLVVDDENTCTADSCDPVTGVSHDPLGDGSSCDDGDLCTTTDSCQAGVCQGADPITCGALDSCHEAGVCDPSTGLCSDPVKPDGSTCDDGIACTAGDTCQAGVCEGGSAPSIEEAPCQVATCDGETGGVVYTQAAEGTACQPDACSQGLCNAAGECIVTTSSVVDDGDPCTIDYCDPILGPTHSECPELDQTVATTVLDATSWLFSGMFPVQTGVNPADIEKRRAALLRGSVTTRTGDPIPSVQVTVNGHPEFGQTLTQADGSFDMVVNGGGTLQVQFHKAGYLDSARRIDPRWNQTHEVDPVILIPPDPAVTEIVLDAASTDFQVARGSVMTDEDGSRQGTLLFPPGVVATMRHADGTLQMINDLHVRITEFTVGPEGPDSMPATLPTNTGYTYAFEVNADEAVAAGAPEIEFSQALPYYLENFIGFPVGEVVPIGSYDREQGLWIPHDNGVVLEILDTTSGQAELDLTGNGVAATPAELTAAGITPEELTTLATLHAPGTTLWRVEIPHFTQPYDINWPFHFPDDAESPEEEVDPPEDPDEEVKDECEVSGASTLECEAQVYRESIALRGLPFSLHYSSARVPGRLASYQKVIHLTSASPPDSLKRVDVSMEVAGRKISASYPPDAQQDAVLSWDGRDAFGGIPQGRQQVDVNLSYVYDGVYGRASRFNDPSLGHFPPGLSGDKARGELAISKQWRSEIGGSSVDNAGLGHWSLSVHHSYDPLTRELLLGDGRRITANAQGSVFEPIETPHPLVSMTVGPDGTIYGCSAYPYHIWAIESDGTARIVAGSGQPGTTGDGGPALQARIRCGAATALDIGPDDAIYFSTFEPGEGVVRRIDKHGIITRVAGAGPLETAGDGDGGSALEAEIWPEEIAVAGDGRVLIAESKRLRMVGTDGIITTIFGTGQSGSWQNMTAVADARTMSGDVASVAVDPASGLIYLLVATVGAGTTPSLIYSLGADGIARHVAGCLPGENCVWFSDNQYNPFLGSAGSSEARFTANGSFLRVGPGGNLYWQAATARPSFPSSQGLVRVFTLGSDRRVRTPFGSRPDGAQVARGGPAFASTFQVGRKNFGMRGDDPVILTGAIASLAALVPPYPGLGVGEIVVPSVEGDFLYAFEQNGRHLRTLHAKTHKVLYEFQYGDLGLLSSIVDAHGQVTQVERSSNGAAVAIVGAHGHRTELESEAEGYLSQVTVPGGSSFHMEYTSGGLLSEFQDPTGGTSHMTYTQDGRIVSDVDRVGGEIQLSRSESENGWTVSRTSSLGQMTTYALEMQVDGSQLKTVTSPNGTTAVSTWTSGGVTTSLSDGTQITTSDAPDPRFSMMSPSTSSTTVLPSGLTRTVSATRTVEMADELVPSSLISQTDTTRIAGLSHSTTFTKADLAYTSTSPEGRLSKAFIDEFGRMIALQGPGAPTVRTVYTVDKLTAIIIDPDGIDGNGDERTTEMTYDTTGRLISVVDPLTQVTAFTNYDLTDRPGTITLPDSSEVNMTYDVEGNVASVTPPGKAPHNMTYGIWGRIESYTPPVGNAVTYDYDLDRHIDLIDFGADALGQPHQVDFVWDNPTGQLQSITSPTGTIDVGYTQGKMTSLISPSLAGPITTNIAYDGPLPTDLSWSGPVAGQVSWTYNDRFLIETETIGALPETTVTYQYDDDGLVTQAGDLTITRDPASGRVTSKTIGSIRERFQYNEFAELSRQTVELMAGSTVVETLYDVIYDDSGVNGARDALGRITKKTERIVQGDVPGATARPLASRTFDYGYNPDGRPWLESVAVDGSVVSSYGYDANGNRTSAELSWSQLGYDVSFDVSLSEADTEYNDADQLLTYGDTTYEWNNFGQLASKTDSSTGEVTFYEYDLYGNLLSVALPDGRTIEYDVDGAGRRVGRRVLDAQGTEIEYRGWIYRDLLRPIAEVDALGNVVARYVYAAPISSPRTTAPESIEWLDASGVVTDVWCLIKDQIGSVRLAVDQDGEVIERRDYDAFGRVLTDFPSLQPFGFAGGTMDEATGLVRFGARDYDPLFGRWTSRDPILFKSKSLNLYAYVANSPIMLSDPSGLTFLEVDRDAGMMYVDPERDGESGYWMPITSGTGNCMNNSSCEGRRDEGPVPGGQYQIDSSKLTQQGGFRAMSQVIRGRGDWGSFYAPLDPYEGTDTLGRDGFYLHGGAYPGSAGCVDAGGGFFGNGQTERLVNDILSDPDGSVGVIVF